MQISLRIRGIEVPEDAYETLVAEYCGTEASFVDSIVLTFTKFHDTVLGDTRILLRKSAFPWDLCNGVVLLSNSFLRSADESREHSADILHSRYLNKAASYDFQRKETVGVLHYTISRRIFEAEKLLPGSGDSGFVQRMFGFLISERKAGIMLNVKKLMDHINSGSHGCRLRILFGGVMIEKYLAEINDSFTRNIKLVLEVDEDNLPRILRDSACSTASKCGMKRLFRVKLLETEGGAGSRSPSITRILSSEGYRICTLPILLRMKQLFYFAMGSYAHSWPSMFINIQRQVSDSIPGGRKAVLEILGIENNDLLCICLSPLETVQHVVFYDRVGDRVVVSFKGTTNSEDTIQDINCEYALFCGGFVHNGFKTQAALFIEKYISQVADILRKTRSTRLLLVGHSLGGAISILVNIMLQRMGLLRDIEVETVAFSSPPVVSEDVARQYRERITVVNYGNDMIPRMSYGSILDLKFLCCSIGERHGPLDAPESIEDEVETVLAHLRDSALHPKLYFPGELIHVKRIRCSLNENVNPLVVFRTVDMRFFEEIILIKHAPKHHTVGHFGDVVKEGIALLEQSVQTSDEPPQ